MTAEQINRLQKLMDETKEPLDTLGAYGLSFCRDVQVSRCIELINQANDHRQQQGIVREAFFVAVALCLSNEIESLQGELVLRSSQL